jgi:pimeloyl-ACP methyl ester carboxylesterase
LFPTAWADRLDDFFVNARLRYLADVGHFTPLECPRDFAAALAAAAGTTSST